MEIGTGAQMSQLLERHLIRTSVVSIAIYPTPVGLHNETSNPLADLEVLDHLVHELVFV